MPNRWTATDIKMCAQRVFEILDRTPSVNQDDGRVLDSIEGNIEVCNVCFAYPSRPDALVLSGVTMQLHKVSRHG